MRATLMTGARGHGYRACRYVIGMSLAPFSGRSPPMPMFDFVARMPLAMLVVARDQRLAFANASAETLFGFAPGKLTGRLVHLVVSLVAASAPASAPVRFASRKDGTQFPVDVVTSVMDGFDTLHTFVIDRSREQLAHLSRVSMLGELAASLAHELNQPLTAILSNAQAAQHFMNLAPIDLDEVREILADLVVDNNRASEILKRIRALARKDTLEFAPLSIEDVIGDVALLVQSDAVARGIGFALDIELRLPPVYGDKVQLQ